MKKQFLTILFIALYTLFCSNANAQSSIQPNLKFGNPNKEEMSITTCPYDSSAKAMVLCSITDVSYIYAVNTFKIEYSIKKRIKILSQEGVDEANISIPYYSPQASGGSREAIRSIKATAYNMVNGKMVKTKMSNDLIFEERLDKQQMVTKFTVPQVKAGTVIEYQYIKSSDFFYHIDTWMAQETIPTLYTAYDVEIPGIFVFNLEQTGSKSLQYSQEAANRAYITNSDPEQTTRYSFKGNNLPAIKSDPFVWCPAMYANKIDFELRSINIPGQYYKNFTTSWQDIDEMLMKDEDFGDRIKRGNPLKDEMKAARIDTISDFKRKVAATYLLLKKKVKWDGSYALFGNSSRNVLKEGKASNADINFLLMNMLKSLNIKTAPMVLRTRNQGSLPLTHPSIESLNTFAVGIYENDTTMYVFDGSAEKGYLDVLPAKLLTNAHIVNGGEYNIMKKGAAKQSIIIKATLKSDGQLEGLYTSKYYGNSSLRKKASFLEAKDSTEYVSKIAKEMNANIQKYSLNGIHKYSPQAYEKIQFDKNIDMGDIVYFSPMMEKPFRDVPFTAEKRDMPVEIDCPMLVSYNMLVKIPQGYTIEDVPQPKILRSPDSNIIFRTQSQYNDGILSTMYTFHIKKALFFQDEYPGLKNFFEDVYKELDNVIVLKKISQ